MHTPEIIETFIEKRAQGASLQRIADQIGVSKTTLVAWNQKYAVEIATAQQDAGLEYHARAREKLTRREAQLDTACERIAPIIQHFDPRELSCVQAFRLYFLIQRETLRLQHLLLKNDQAAAKLIHPCGQARKQNKTSDWSNNGQDIDQTEKPPRSISENLTSKRSSSGQEKRKPAVAKPNPISDNFLTLLNTPPEPAILKPAKTTNGPDASIHVSAKIPKEVLDKANSIFGNHLPPPGKTGNQGLQPKAKSFLAH